MTLRHDPATIAIARYLAKKHNLAPSEILVERSDYHNVDKNYIAMLPAKMFEAELRAQFKEIDAMIANPFRWAVIKAAVPELADKLAGISATLKNAGVRQTIRFDTKFVDDLLKGKV